MMADFPPPGTCAVKSSGWWDFIRICNEEVRQIDEETKQMVSDMHVGRLLHILSHSMRRHNPTRAMEDAGLTTIQKHVLKFILLETMHRELYQKDIEEEFQVRKSTATGTLQLMEKNGYIYRENAREDARLKRIVPTEKALSLRQAILQSIEEDEISMLRGISREEVELCKQVLWQMYVNRKEYCDCTDLCRHAEDVHKKKSKEDIDKDE